MNARAVAATTKKTGLGVRNRVALLGGQLKINSQLGRGSIISFGIAE